MPKAHQLDPRSPMPDKTMFCKVCRLLHALSGGLEVLLYANQYRIGFSLRQTFRRIVPPHPQSASDRNRRAEYSRVRSGPPEVSIHLQATWGRRKVWPSVHRHNRYHENRTDAGGSRGHYLDSFRPPFFFCSGYLWPQSWKQYGSMATRNVACRRSPSRSPLRHGWGG